MTSQFYLVSTPIGNLADITLRAIEILKQVDVIACEDTRRTDKLLNHYGIRNRLIRYDEHTHHAASKNILSLLSTGKNVALVTDAGTPGISDPGSRLVPIIKQAGYAVIPIPGASALVTSVSATGWGSDGFVFLGFLPRKPGPGKRLLRESLGLGKTVVLYESPFRVDSTLNVIADLHPEMSVCVARELTKIHEEFVQGKVNHVIQEMKKRPQKGEVVILVDPADIELINENT